MILILTNFGSDRKCLVNISNTETSYVVWDVESQRYKTKICFRGNESFIFVEESLQEIHKLSIEFHIGFHQISSWETKSINEHLEKTLTFSLNKEHFLSLDF